MKADNSRKILEFLLSTGMISVACTSPYFISKIIKHILKRKSHKLFDEKKFTCAFNYLRKKELIKIEKDGYDVQIMLTEKGKEKARKYQIDNLEIEKPKIWDGKWRIIIFDILDKQRIKRDAFRKKLKELGFYSLQKSVWAHPFDCKKEIKFLREFFGLDKKQIEILLVEKIENDLIVRKMKDIYKI